MVAQAAVGRWLKKYRRRSRSLVRAFRMTWIAGRSAAGLTFRMYLSSTEVCERNEGDDALIFFALNGTVSDVMA